MRFSMEESELSKFETFVQNYVDDLQSENTKMNTEINTVLLHTKYYKLQKLIMYLMEHYNDLIEKQLIKDTYEKWIESDSSFVKLMRLYHVGEDAEGICDQTQKHIENILTDTMKVDVKEVATDTSNPIIKTEDYDAVKNACSNFCNEVESIFSEYNSQLIALQEENNIYKCLGALFILIKSFITSFVENMEIIFHKEEREAEDILVRIQRNVEDAVAQCKQNVLDENEGAIVCSGNASGSGSVVEQGTVLADSQEATFDGNADNGKKSSLPAESVSEKSIIHHLKRAADYLNSPEKREEIKRFLQNCKDKVEECVEDGSGFNKVRDAIKPFVKKYGKPIAEILSAVSPILGAVHPVAGKIIKCIPDISDSIFGEDEDDSNLPKVDAGLRMLKALEFDDLPENGEEIEKLVSGHVDDFKRELGKTLFGDLDPGIMKLFGVDIEEINDLFGISGEEKYDTNNIESFDSSVTDVDTDLDSAGVKANTGVRADVGYVNATMTTNKLIDQALKKVDRDEMAQYIKDEQKALEEDRYMQQLYEEQGKAEQEISRGNHEKNASVYSQDEYPRLKQRREKREKYSDAIRQACGVVPSILVEEPAVAKAFSKQLPQIMECMDGKVNGSKDLAKAALGMDCLKTLNFDKMPTDANERQRYLNNNSRNICNDLVDMIMKNPDYREALDFRPDAIESPEMRKLFAEKTGQTSVVYPAKPNPYNYDFDKYEPDALSKLRPKVSREQMNQVSDAIKGADFDRVDVRGIERELAEIKHSLNDDRGYVTISPSSELGGLIDLVRNAIGTGDATPILQNNDRRYNKAEIEGLVSALDSGLRQGHSIQNGVDNFVKRDMGYPVCDDNGNSIVQDMKELIPVLNDQEIGFLVENQDINELIGRASHINTMAGGKLMKQRVLSSLMEDATLFATMIGVGTLFATAGFVPAVTLFIGCSIAWMVHEDVAAAYAKLVVTLGSERTDMLLEHYRMDDGYYKYY